jgi:hypothetical protein
MWRLNENGGLDADLSATRCNGSVPGKKLKSAGRDQPRRREQPTRRPQNIKASLSPPNPLRHYGSIICLPSDEQIIIRVNLHTVRNRYDVVNKTVG